MAKASLNLKIKKANIIKSLETALAERVKRYAEQEAKEAKHLKDLEAYYATIAKLIKSGKGKMSDITSDNWHWRKNKGVSRFSLTVELPVSLVPKEPEAPKSYSEYEYKSDKEALENALRLLKMCEDEYVSASTLKSVSEYL
jgi:hypothetical protein